MPARTRDEEPRERTAEPFSEWMAEVTVLMERITGRQDVQQGAIDRLSTEVRSATDTARIAALALERIARAEESREKRAGETELHDRQNRQKWVDRVMGSSWFQLLAAGVVLAILQGLGTAALVLQLAP